MQSHDDPLRRIAILIGTLDTDSADTLLDELPPGEAERVRRIMVELDDVDVAAEQAVLDEFFQAGLQLFGTLCPPSADDQGVELCLSQTVEAGEALCPAAEPSACFLPEAECEKLGQLLASERPQTIALVLSQLSEQRALQTLALLPETLQTDVLRRWIDLDVTDRSVLREVEQELQARIAQLLGPLPRRGAGLAQVAGLVQAADPHLKRQLLDNLAQCDTVLAEQISVTRLEFEDLAYFDAKALALLVGDGDPQVVVLALAGANESFVAQVMAALPSAQSRQLEKAMSSLGPTRLSDIEAAQRELARRAEDIFQRGDAAVSTPPLGSLG